MHLGIYICAHIHICIKQNLINKDAINFKESKVEYTEGFGGKEKKWQMM